MANLVVKSEQKRGRRPYHRNRGGFSTLAVKAARVLNIDLYNVRSVTELRRAVTLAWRRQAWAYHPDQSDHPDVDELSSAEHARTLLSSIDALPSCILLSMLIENGILVSSEALAKGTDEHLQVVDMGYGWQLER